MVKEHKNSSVGIYTKVNTKTENLMDMVNIFGLMDHIIKDISKMDLKMGMGCGKGTEAIAISTKDNF